MESKRGEGNKRRGGQDVTSTECKYRPTTTEEVKKERKNI